MTRYELLLTLHVFAAIVWLGAGLIMTILLFVAHRAGDRAREGTLHGEMSYLAPMVFIPASLATLIFGVLTGLEGDWDFGQAWIVIGLAGWLASFLIGFFYFKPESERIEAIVAEHGPDSPEAERRGARMSAVDRFELTILYLVVAAMVIKPTGDDVGVLFVGAAILAAVALSGLLGRSGATSSPASKA